MSQECLGFLDFPSTGMRSKASFSRGITDSLDCLSRGVSASAGSALRVSRPTGVFKARRGTMSTVDHLPVPSLGSVQGSLTVSYTHLTLPTKRIV